MKKHIITIAGNNGGGKSSASTGVSNLLGYQKKSTGDFMRKMASERGITLEELAELAEKDPSIDIALDDYNREIGKEENIVLDSRLGFHFIPEAFKVFLFCDSKTAAKRVIEDSKNNPNRHNETRQGLNTIEEVAKSLEDRLESERKRYKEMYGIENHTDPKKFNLVIDTSNPKNNKEVVPRIIVEAYNKWLEE